MRINDKHWIRLTIVSLSCYKNYNSVSSSFCPDVTKPDDAYFSAVGLTAIAAEK